MKNENRWSYYQLIIVNYSLSTITTYRKAKKTYGY